jgi:hypothetical protein
MEEMLRKNAVQRQNTLAILLKQQEPDPKSTTKQGYLFKRKGQLKKDWVKRFFIVTDGMMLEKKVKFIFSK